MKSKVVFFEVLDNERPLLEAGLQKYPDISAEFSRDRLTAANADIAKDAAAVSIFINSVVTKEIIDSLPAVKIIATRSTGFDHIDKQHAALRGISIANVPAYGSRTVAEFTFALILGLSRKILEASYREKSHRDAAHTDLRGFDLIGKTIGIIGTGRIGQNTIQIAKGFGMEVLAYDAFPNDKLGITYVGLDDLLSRSDVVTLHAPYNKDTYHLINKTNIQKFKPGSILINTARGELCDTEALLWGVEHGVLAGVGLDVIEGERSMTEGGSSPAVIDRFLERPEVFLTPHMAYYTVEAQTEIAKTTIDNITGFFAGTLKSVV